MIGSLLLVLALLLCGLALRLRRATGIPWTRIRSSDTSGWRRPDQPLLSRRYGVVGQPDYVLETRHGLVPVEVKPQRRARTPYPSDLLQLAAYCLLIEDTTSTAPGYGLLRYADQTFRLPYTDQVRTDLLDLLAEMRADQFADDVPRSHDEPGRCRGCGVAYACDDRLG